MTISYNTMQFYFGLFIVATSIISLVAWLKVGRQDNEREEAYRGRLLTSTGMTSMGLSFVFAEPEWLHWTFLLAAVIFVISGWTFIWKGRTR